MKPLLNKLLVMVPALLVAAQATAFQAGWRQLSVEGATADAAATAVSLYYPTQAPAAIVPMGPYAPNIAVQGPPEATVKGLIVLSHGTGGSELGQSSLAEALARSGYLVAALRHPGDNWRDMSLLQKTPERYFIERPRQVTRVIDALLADPMWKDRIARDARGPRIGAVGHSAGGYTVLALAGAEPDLTRIAKHCASESADDPVFCGMGRPVPATGAAEPAAAPASGLGDGRVRAVVALAPVGVVFTASSLARIRIPVALYAAELDRWLVPRFHAEWIAQNVPGIELHRVANAWHLAFLDKPSIPIATPNGDLGADSPGFDRAAFLRQLAVDVPAFFGGALR
jgi:predicted dienelactone hydrolase